MSTRIPATVLGATGVVGQRLVARLARHPLFEIRHLAASGRNSGRTYAEACSWRLGDRWGPPWGGFGAQRLVEADPGAALSPVVFSALDAEAAREIEPAFAAAGAMVCSNAGAFRMEPDVPLLIPEVNPEHLGLIATQRRARGWSGAIVCNPNCTATVLAMALAPLHEVFGIEAVVVTSLQAVSGAGHPGVSSLDIQGNVLPWIRGEEPKVESETAKMLGRLENGAIVPAAIAVSAACHRVAVVDGHTEAVSLRLGGDPTPEAVRAVLLEWSPEPQRLGLHTAPARPIVLHQAEDRPQPRLDVEAEGGMCVHVGRIRRCAVLGIKMELLGHNAERGAAGAAVLDAELLVQRGLLA